jgi:hypothetical protein
MAQTPLPQGADNTVVQQEQWLRQEALQVVDRLRKGIRETGSAGCTHHRFAHPPPGFAHPSPTICSSHRPHYSPIPDLNLLQHTPHSLQCLASVPESLLAWYDKAIAGQLEAADDA